MKKILILLAVLLVLVGCQGNNGYPQLEGETADMSGYNGLVSEQFVVINIDRVLKLVEEKKTGIVYLGYSSCPWCNCLVPVLNEVSLARKMRVYYLDYHAEDNFENPKLFDLVDLCDQAGLITEHGDDNTAKFYFPTVIYIQNGKIVDLHSGTVAGHDAQSGQLSEKQRARLQYMLEKEFDALIKQ